MSANAAVIGLEVQNSQALSAMDELLLRAQKLIDLTSQQYEKEKQLSESSANSEKQIAENVSSLKKKLIEDVEAVNKKASQSAISDDEKAAEAMERNIDRIIKEKKKAQETADAELAKETAAKQKAEEKAEQLAAKETAAKQKEADKQKTLLEQLARQAEISAQAPLKAQERIAAEEKKLSEIRIKYSKDDGTQIINDIKKIQDQRAVASNAYKKALADGSSEEAKVHKQAMSDMQQELALMKQEALEKEKVNKGGEGGKAGLLGTGRQIVSGEGGGGGIVGALGGAASSFLPMAAGATAAVAALGKLYEAGEAARKEIKELTIGLQAGGMAHEEAAAKARELADSSKKLALQYGVDHKEINEGTTAYLKMGGSTDNLAEKQKLLIGLANKSGASMEMVGKMVAKASDPENATNLGKMGIKFQQGATEAEKFAIIAQKVKGNLSGMEENVSPITRMKEMFSQLTETVGTLVFSVLNPFVSIVAVLISGLMPLISIIEDLGKQLGDLVKDALAPVQEIFTVLTGIISDYLMPIIKVVINIALVPLKIVIWEIKTAIDIWIGIFKFLFNVLGDFIGWFGKVSGITDAVTTSFNWVSQAVKDVIAWFNKAVETVKSVGSTILSLIGIHTEEQKSTKKSTEALQEKKKALEDAAAATDKMAESVRKQNDESSKGSKQEADNTIAMLQLVDDKIKNPLLRSKGETEEGLKQLRAVWVEHGKQQVKIYEGLDEQHKQYAIEIGATSADTVKKAKDTTKKIAHDAYEEGKNNLNTQKNETLVNIEKAYVEQTEIIINGETYKSLTKKQYQEKDKEVNLQNLIAMRELAIKFHNEEAARGVNAHKELLNKYEADINSTTKSITDIQVTLRDANTKQEVDALKIKFEKLKELAEDDAETKNLTERQRNKIFFDLKVDEYTQEIALLKSHGEDTLALEKQLEDTRIANRALLKKQSIVDFKEQLKSGEDIDKAKIDAMKDGLEKQLALEDYRVKKEKDAIQERLKDVKINQDQANKLNEIAEEEHAKKLKDIRDKEFDDINKHITNVHAAFSIGGKERLNLIADTAEKEYGITSASRLKEQGGLVKFLTDNLIKFTTAKIAEATVTTTTESIKTGATLAGYASRAIAIAGEVAQLIWASTKKAAIAVADVATDIWKAGASMVGAVASGIANVFKIMPFPLDFIFAAAVPAALFGLFKGAKALFKFADGGIVDRPQHFQFGKNGEHEGLRGEAGPEAIIPLSKLPGLIRETAGGGTSVDAGGHLVKKMDELITATKTRPQPHIMDQHNTRLSLDQDLYESSLRHFVQ